MSYFVHSHHLLQHQDEAQSVCGFLDKKRDFTSKRGWEWLVLACEIDLYFGRVGIKVEWHNEILWLYGVSLHAL